MNIIKGFPDNGDQSPVSQIRNIANNGREIRQADHAKAENGDQADMSVLSQFMARSARELASELQPRLDVVNRVRHDGDKVVMSDQVVDTILSRMLGD